MSELFSLLLLAAESKSQVVKAPEVLDPAVLERWLTGSVWGLIALNALAVVLFVLSIASPQIKTLKASLKKWAEERARLKEEARQKKAAQAAVAPATETPAAESPAAAASSEAPPAVASPTATSPLPPPPAEPPTEAKPEPAAAPAAAEPPPAEAAPQPEVAPVQAEPSATELAAALEVAMNLGSTPPPQTTEASETTPETDTPMESESSTEVIETLTDEISTSAEKAEPPTPPAATPEQALPSSDEIAAAIEATMALNADTPPPASPETMGFQEKTEILENPLEPSDDKTEILSRPDFAQTSQEQSTLEEKTEELSKAPTPAQPLPEAAVSGEKIGPGKDMKFESKEDFEKTLNELLDAPMDQTEELPIFDPSILEESLKKAADDARRTSQKEDV